MCSMFLELLCLDHSCIPGVVRMQEVLWCCDNSGIIGIKAVPELLVWQLLHRISVPSQSFPFTTPLLSNSSTSGLYKTTLSMEQPLT